MMTVLATAIRYKNINIDLFQYQMMQILLAEGGQELNSVKGTTFSPIKIKVGQKWRQSTAVSVLLSH